MLIVLSGCVLTSTHERAEDIAKHAEMHKTVFSVNGFELVAFSRLSDKNKPVNVYIEGDGLAWISRYELSGDPTPKFALGLKLATLDSSENVIYLARPCQFNDFKRIPCASTYWSDKRFSEKVINALDRELDSLVINKYNSKLNLIGYSGGAAVATLLAARRKDVVSLRTIAGNLDHVYLNQYHNVSPMQDSLNPIDVAQQLSQIPQLHFIGKKDKIIPKEIALRFVEKLDPATCAEIVNVEAEHQNGWVENWSSLLNTPL